MPTLSPTITEVPAVLLPLALLTFARLRFRAVAQFQLGAGWLREGGGRSPGAGGR